MDLQESYKVLELEKTHCLQEVKQAYRDIVFVWHPDRLENNQRIKKKAEKKLQQINLAYEILSKHLSGKLPDFVKIVIEPDLAKVNYHQSKVFTAWGIDAQGKKTVIEQVKWESSGGTIYPDGLFFADDELGNYTITASLSTLKAQAKVKIVKPAETNNKEVIETQVTIFQSLKHKLQTKLKNYLQNHPAIARIISWKKSVLNFLALLKWIIWGAIGWIIMSDHYLSTETINLSTKLTFLLFISWLMGTISPHLVINFGIDKVDSDLSTNTKAKVSIFYSVLTSICLGVTMATSPILTTASLNGLQSGILGLSAMTMIFTLIYPQGSIMASIINRKPQRNRFTAGFSCLILSLLSIGLIGLCR